MSCGLLPTLAELETVFVDEVEYLEGRVIDAAAGCDDVLLQRAVFDTKWDATAGEIASCGVAIRTVQQDLLIRPFLRFQRRGNGLLLAESPESRRLRRVDFMDDPSTAEDVMLCLRTAVHACAGAALVDRVADRLREAACLRAEASAVAALIERAGIAAPICDQVERMIVSRFAIDEPPTVYGALQAVSCIASDLADHATRWRLEELAGSVLHTLSLSCNTSANPSSPPATPGCDDANAACQP